MNRFTVLKTIAALFAAAALAGCSLLKVSVSTGEPIAKEDMNVRTMTRGFYYDFAGEIARTADSIVQAAPDAETQLAAIRWKIRATRAAVSAAMQAIPDVALADTWILTRRMNAAFAATPDSLLFGGQSGLARETASKLDERAAKLARDVLPQERYELMARFVEEYMRANPFADDGAEPANTTLAWLEYLRDNDVEHAYATGTIAEVLADVNDRVSGQTQQLANSVGWSKDMLEIRLRQDSLRSGVSRQLDSLQHNFNRLVGVAEHLPEISEEMVKGLREQAAELIRTMNYSVDNAFSNLDRQRDELQRYISSEREALIDQARSAVDSAVQEMLAGIPGLIGKVLFYVVLALVVLLGLPFLIGFWLGGWRARAKAREK